MTTGLSKLSRRYSFEENVFYKAKIPEIFIKVLRIPENVLNKTLFYKAEMTSNIKVMLRNPFHEAKISEI